MILQRAHNIFGDGVNRFALLPGKLFDEVRNRQGISSRRWRSGGSVIENTFNR